MTFAAQVADWQTFYTAVVGLAGTLIGLLFVGLGLNPQVMAVGGPAGMRVMAAQTFHNFLVLLVLALIVPIPDDSARTLAVTLLVIGAQGVVRVGLDLRRARRDADPRWSAVSSLFRYASPAAAYAIAFWLGLDLWDGDSAALGAMVAIVFLLLMSAAISCWDLLEAIGDLQARSGQ